MATKAAPVALMPWSALATGRGIPMPITSPPSWALPEVGPTNGQQHEQSYSSTRQPTPCDFAFKPQRRFLLILNLGGGTGLATWGRFHWNGRLAFRLKDRIDRAFLREYQECLK